MADYTDSDLEYSDGTSTWPIAPIAPIGPISNARRAETENGQANGSGNGTGQANGTGQTSDATPATTEVTTGGGESGAAVTAATSVALATRTGLSSDLPVLRIGWEPYQPTAWPSPWRFFVAIPVALLIIALAAGSAFTISSRQPAIREARAEVRLHAPDGADAAQADRLLNTAAAAAVSPSVLEPLARRHGLTLEELEKKVSVTVLPRTSLIQVSVKDELPSRALVVADVLTGQLLTDTALERGAVIGQATEADLAQVNVDIATLQAQIDTIAEEPPSLVTVGPLEQQALDTTGRQARLDNLITQLREKLVRRTDLEQKREAQRLDELARQPELVTATQLRPEPVGPRPVRDAALGAMAGSLVAAPIAALLLRFQPRRNRARGR